MPELPDVAAYLHALHPRVVGQPLQRLRLLSPFLLRSVEPPAAAAEGRTVLGTRRIGKRLVLCLERELCLVLHLMIAGRLRWLERGRRPPARITLAALEFPAGVLAITEAGTKKRAALYVVQGETGLAALDPGGLEVLTCSADEFVARLRSANHTLKRALTDPRLLAGIGNAYSDEILHAARLSPLARTQDLDANELRRLHEATGQVLGHWTAALSEQFARRFPGPGEVTAFRPEFAVHGKFGRPCPACGAPVQRIRYADNETNYCPGCQTQGRILSDRSLARLLRSDWPRTLEELEKLPHPGRADSAPL